VGRERAARVLRSSVAAAMLAAHLARGPSLVPRTAEDQAMVSAGAALMGGAAGALDGLLATAIGRRLPGGSLAAGAGLAGAGFLAWRWAAAQPRPTKRIDAVEAAGLVTALAASTGGVGAAFTGRLWQAALAYAAARATRGAARAARALLALRARIEEPHDLVKASVVYDYLPSVSGGDGSLAPLAALDREGRKFLGLATPASAIGEVMSESAQDPVRVFVGLGSADAPAERVRLAVAELERLGAFERRRLIVACPVGSGYVNPAFVEAEEYMSRGDVATVAVQYNNERSFRSLKSVPRARETYRLLLEALHARLVGGDGRPEIVFYGESLGAWVGAELLAEGGLELVETLGVERGVLLGIPHGGAYKLVRLRGASARLPEGLGVFGTADELEALPAEDRAGLRYVIVTHPEDPVANYTGLQLLWRRPFWLRPGARSPRIPAAMRWMPGITFLQVLFDVKNGTSFVPVFEPRAHDYRAEHPAVVRIAYGHDDVTDEQLGAIAARTVASAERQWERERGRPWR
jgi:uncharacterized membrane protein